MRLEVLIAVTKTVAAFFYLISFSLVFSYQHFRGTCSLSLQSEGGSGFLRNFGNLLPDCTASHTKRQQPRSPATTGDDVNTKV